MSSGITPDGKGRPDLGETIRRVRKAEHLTTTEFAKLLGVNQASVSRWECGQRRPELAALFKLSQIAEGVNKNVILSALSELLRRPIQDEEAKHLADEILRDEKHLRRVAEWLKMPNHVRFGRWAKFILGAEAEVDESIAEIVELWCSWAMKHPEHAIPYFRDAAHFLRTGFHASPAFADPELPSKPSRKRRVS